MLHAIPSSDLHISLHLSSLSGHPSSSSSTPEMPGWLGVNAAIEKALFQSVLWYNVSSGATAKPLMRPRFFFVRMRYRTRYDLYMRGCVRASSTHVSIRNVIDDYYYHVVAVTSITWEELEAVGIASAEPWSAGGCYFGHDRVRDWHATQRSLECLLAGLGLIYSCRAQLKGWGPL